MSFETIMTTPLQDLLMGSSVIVKIKLLVVKAAPKYLLLGSAVRLVFEFSRTFLTMGISRKLLLSRIRINKPQLERAIIVFTSTH